jgi:hypothetical protein
MMGKIVTRNKKAVVGIAALAFLWINGMKCDPYRPATSFKNQLELIHVVLWSLWLDSSPVANDGPWVR